MKLLFKIKIFVLLVVTTGISFSQNTRIAQGDLNKLLQEGDYVETFITSVYDNPYSNEDIFMTNNTETDVSTNITAKHNNIYIRTSKNNTQVTNLIIQLTDEGHIRVYQGFVNQIPPQSIINGALDVVPQAGYYPLILQNPYVR